MCDFSWFTADEDTLSGQGKVCFVHVPFCRKGMCSQHKSQSTEGAAMWTDLERESQHSHAGESWRPRYTISARWTTPHQEGPCHDLLGKPSFRFQAILVPNFKVNIISTNTIPV